MEICGIGLIVVVVQEGNLDVVEVRLVNRIGGLEVLLNQEVLSFIEQSWMDLKGMFLLVVVGDRVFIMLVLGVGLEVSVQGLFLSVFVLLFEKFFIYIYGFFGIFNNDFIDDFILYSGCVLFLGISFQELFLFGVNWIVYNVFFLFIYDFWFLVYNFLY